MSATVLVVDDQERPRRALATELEDAGYQVVQACDGLDAWERFCQAPPDVVITDLVMPQADGLELLSRIRSRSDLPVILFTAHGTVQSAATAFKAGADDFVASPDVEIDDLVELIESAVRGSRAGEGSHGLESRLAGHSRAMNRLRERVAALAPLKTPVLLCGEAGSGRNAIAKALHELGSTADGKLVCVDGADFRPGSRIPDCAALYLDRIERLPAEVQAFFAQQIARTEQDNFRFGPRLFASSTGLSTTPQDPGAYQELRAVMLRFALDIPPLRTMTEDIPAIADALVDRAGETVGRKVRLSPSARAFLAVQPWPGNISQMARVLERAITFTRGRQIRRDVVSDIVEETGESLDRIREQQTALERQVLLKTIRETGGNISRTADIMGRSRSAIYRLIEKYGIPLSRPS